MDDELEKRSSYRDVWRRAFEKTKKVYRDPWAEYQLEKLPARLAKRYRYDAKEKKWSSDLTLVKLEAKPFARGGLRECYRMKKLSQQPNRPRVHVLGWKDANNYVAKKPLAITQQDKKEIESQVEIQQVCASIADAFDDLKPPKSVTIVDCFMIQVFKGKISEEESDEFLLCERYLDGGVFEKHNSNEGSVETMRLTPQVFSAASFWLTRGQAMVIDVQGVGDLYTDPCLHTLVGNTGAGDLGPRGMALFFESCDTHNPLLDLLKVPKFQLAPSQIHQHRRTIRHATTSCDLWKSVNRRRPGTTLFKKNREATFRQLSPHDLDAIDRVLDAADSEACKALDTFLESFSLLPEKNNTTLLSSDITADANDLRRLNPFAIAQVHAAFAELETEAFFDHNKIDTAAALFHCAKAAIKGSPIAAHSLARWHADLPPGALLPRFSDLKYAYPNKAGPLLVLAAVRGDPAAQFAAAQAFLVPRWGLPYSTKAAKLLLLEALRHAKAQDAIQLLDLQPRDYVLAKIDGLPHKAIIQSIYDDGSIQLNFDLFSDDSEDNSSLLVLPRSRIIQKLENEDELYAEPIDDFVLPPGNAGADLPPSHLVLATLADLFSRDDALDQIDGQSRADFLQQAIDAATAIKAFSCAENYREALCKM